MSICLWLLNGKQTRLICEVTNTVFSAKVKHRDIGPSREIQSHDWSDKVKWKKRQWKKYPNPNRQPTIWSPQAFTLSSLPAVEVKQFDNCQEGQLSTCHPENKKTKQKKIEKKAKPKSPEMPEEQNTENIFYTLSWCRTRMHARAHTHLTVSSNSSDRVSLRCLLDRACGAVEGGSRKSLSSCSVFTGQGTSPTKAWASVAVMALEKPRPCRGKAGEGQPGSEWVGWRELQQSDAASVWLLVCKNMFFLPSLPSCRLVYFNPAVITNIVDFWFLVCCHDSGRWPFASMVRSLKEV